MHYCFCLALSRSLLNLTLWAQHNKSCLNVIFSRFSLVWRSIMLFLCSIYLLLPSSCLLVINISVQHYDSFHCLPTWECRKFIRCICTEKRCMMSSFIYFLMKKLRLQENKWHCQRSCCQSNIRTSSLHIGGAETHFSWKSHPRLSTENRFCASMSNAERGISS